MSVVFGRRGPPFWVLDFGLIIFTFQLLTEKGGTNAEAGLPKWNKNDVH